MYSAVGYVFGDLGQLERYGANNKNDVRNVSISESERTDMLSYHRAKVNFAGSFDECCATFSQDWIPKFVLSDGVWVKQETYNAKAKFVDRGISRYSLKGKDGTMKEREARCDEIDWEGTFTPEIAVFRGKWYSRMVQQDGSGKYVANEDKDQWRNTFMGIVRSAGGSVLVTAITFRL
jgi:hypothetical protein